MQSLALGALLLARSSSSARSSSRASRCCASPVDQLLDHARFGSLPVVLAITFVNGVVEELYFRGALYAALPAPRVSP